jgi:hypothetical protein
MQKWEYMEIYTDKNTPSEREIAYVNGAKQKEGRPFDQKYINQLGSFGWELVIKNDNFYIFKRPKE